MTCEERYKIYFLFPISKLDTFQLFNLSYLKLDMDKYILKIYIDV